MSYRAVTRDGTEIEPSAGIVPIMKEVEEDRYAVIGTGFYITRYGLFMTAAHVLSELVNWKEQEIARSRSFVCHLAGDNEVHLRRIVAITISNSVDLAIGQADNYKQKFPDNPLENVMTTFSAENPPVGAELVTYAYPENEILGFFTPRQSSSNRCRLLCGIALEKRRRVRPSFHTLSAL